MPNTPVQTDGRARDANTRVGSNGTNPGGARGGTAVTPNNIVYGNVTVETSPRAGRLDRARRAFRGDTADTSSSNFTRGSAGAAVRGNANLDNTFTRNRYYGSSRRLPAAMHLARPAGTWPPRRSRC